MSGCRCETSWMACAVPVWKPAVTQPTVLRDKQLFANSLDRVLTRALRRAPVANPLVIDETG